MCWIKKMKHCRLRRPCQCSISLDHILSIVVRHCGYLQLFSLSYIRRDCARSGRKTVGYVLIRFLRLFVGQRTCKKELDFRVHVFDHDLSNVYPIHQ